MNLITICGLILSVTCFGSIESSDLNYDDHGTARVDPLFDDNPQTITNTYLSIGGIITSTDIPKVSTSSSITYNTMDPTVKPSTSRKSTIITKKAPEPTTTTESVTNSIIQYSSTAENLTITPKSTATKEEHISTTPLQQTSTEQSTQEYIYSSPKPQTQKHIFTTTKQQTWTQETVNEQTTRRKSTVNSAISPSKPSQASDEKNTTSTVPQGYVSFGDSLYKFHSNATIWPNARDICENEGGYLTIINSQAEEVFIGSLYDDKAVFGAFHPNVIFVGYHDFFRPGQWLTINGKSVKKLSYMHWAPGQPDNTLPYENCAALAIGDNNTAGLDDYVCQFNEPFVCEMSINQEHGENGSQNVSDPNGHSNETGTNNSTSIIPDPSGHSNVTGSNNNTSTIPDPSDNSNETGTNNSTSIVPDPSENSNGTGTDNSTSIVPDPSKNSNGTGTNNSTSTIPEGYAIFGDNLYKFHSNATIWQDARDICENEGGYLAIINSQAEEAFIGNLYNGKVVFGAFHPNVIFVGYHDFFRPGQWLTIDGKSVKKIGYIHWAPGQPDNTLPYENCAALSIGEVVGLDDYVCQYNEPFVCEIPNGKFMENTTPTSPTVNNTNSTEHATPRTLPTTPRDQTTNTPGKHTYSTEQSTKNTEYPTTPTILTTTERPIEKDYLDYIFHNGSLYKFHNNATTWQKARRICENEGAHLTIINSAAEESFIGSLYGSLNVIGATLEKYIFVGYHDFFKPGEWVTIDGKDAHYSYTNWGKNQPDNQPYENCGALFVEPGQVGLYNFVCKLDEPFVCEYEYDNEC